MNQDEVVVSLDGRCYCHTRGPSRHNKIWSCVLLHHITSDLLKQSYLSLERDSAPGIDGV